MWLTMVSWNMEWRIRMKQWACLARCDVWGPRRSCVACPADLWDLWALLSTPITPSPCSPAPLAFLVLSILQPLLLQRLCICSCLSQKASSLLSYLSGLSSYITSSGSLHCSSRWNNLLSERVCVSLCPTLYSWYLAQSQALSECSVRCLFMKCGTTLIIKIVIVLLHIWSIKELDEERCDSIMQYQI